MSVRGRLTILLILVGLVPVLLIIGQSTYSMFKIEEFGSNLLSPIIKQIGAENSQNTVQLISRQMNSFLEINPHLELEKLDELKENKELAAIAITSFGRTGYTMVFNDQLEIIYHGNQDMVGSYLKSDSRQSNQYFNILNLSISNPASVGFVDWIDSNNRTSKKYIAIYQIGATPLRVAGIIDAEELTLAYAPNQFEIQRNAVHIRNYHYIFSLVVILLTILAASSIGKEATSRIRIMAEDTRRILRSLPDPIPVAEKADDLITLHDGITNIAMQVRETQVTFEKQVQATIADMARRNTQIEAVVQVAHEAADSLDIQQMLTHTTHLISDSFGFYHAGIFLIDEAGQYAILAAANSEGGKRMLAREHKIKLSEGGVVSYAASHNQLYHVHDVLEDPIHAPNQDLIHTRSELAIPIQVHGDLIGILDVQSTEPEAYTSEDIRILQLLANQIALAIQNARLLKASQQDLQEMYHEYGKNIQESWLQRKGRKPLGYTFNRLGIEPSHILKNNSPSQTRPQILSEDTEEKLIVPIQMRGQSLGSIVLTREKDQGCWRQEDLLFLQEVAQQAAPALENARLLEEINRRAQMEQQIGYISAKTLSTLNMESVVKTAVQEIGIALNAARVQIRLKPSEPVQVTAPNSEGA
jgi:GAF domain-containing protein